MHEDNVLYFVYDTDSSDLTGLTSSIDKSMSPKKTKCPLMALIISPVGMKKEWKRFIANLGVPAKFLSRDETTHEFKVLTGEEFPAVGLRAGGSLTLLISAEEIRACATLDDLMAIVGQRVFESMPEGE
jgi:hypothetical protein